MTRRLTGAALRAKVIAEVRAELSEDYGLPMGEYMTADVFSHSLGSDMQPDFTVIFRRANGRTLQVVGIIPNNDGTVLQRNADVEMR